MAPLSYKNIFLVDAFGALVTFLLLNQVVARFTGFFGMPTQIALILSFVAAAFAAYSFICHISAPGNPGPFLAIIAIANTLYGIATTILLMTLPLQIPGYIYFIGEIGIIALLVSYEVWIIRSYPGSPLS